MTTGQPLTKGLALAFSGGGIRATVFHLGTLLRLAKSGHLSAVSHISTVSGGSLAVGLVLSANGNNWPTSAEYSEKVLPAIRELVTTRDLQWDMLCQTLMKPWRFVTGRGLSLAKAIEETWGITASLQALPAEPCWFINTTNYYTGKNWRFSRQRMGDWRSGYLDAPDVPLSLALAASAGVPYVVGTTHLDLPLGDWYHQKPGSRERTPMTAPAEESIRLWDGGVYENLGAEALHKIGNGFVYPEIRFLLLSDAGMRLAEGRQNVKGAIYFNGLMPCLSMNIRSLDIVTDQTRALRSRLLVSEMVAGRLPGVYIRIGNTANYITKAAGESNYPTPKISAEAAVSLATFPTVLSRLNGPIFDQLVTHGYETTDATLGAYHPALFPYLG